MVRIIRDLLCGVFAVVFLTVAGIIYWRTGQFSLAIPGVFATLAAAIAGVRFYFILKREFARLEAERRQQREDLFEDSCGEVAEMMSHLSRGDFSVFVTCHRMLERGEASYGFLTSKGSPVHNVLVALTDLRCARPKAMKRLDPSVDISIAEYDLTDLGKALLLTFLQDAVRRRTRREQVAR